MPKQILLFLDGTSNDSNRNDFDSNITNVYKLFCNIRGAVQGNVNPRRDFQKKVCPGQVAFYVWGVGAVEDYLWQLWRQAVASDFEERLLTGYQFIAREYEADDEIILIGYSRGGSAARALADCICTMGVPNTTTDDFATECSQYWKTYNKIPVDKRLTRQPENFEDRVKIKAVCAFDVVAGPGLDTTLVIDGIHQNIDNVYHAVARDERRWLFGPTLWPVDIDGKLVQMSFPGSHADVGGGYKDDFHSYASNVAFNWMKKKMMGVGVQFTNKKLKKIGGNAPPVIHRPWNTFPYSWMWKPPRPRDACVEHGSVHVRKRTYGPEADTDVAITRSEIPRVPYT